MLKRLRSLIHALAGLSMLFAPIATHAAVTEIFGPGDLIRGESFSTVYYFSPDGMRYVFPNEKTYFTWYSDFSGVKMIPDKALFAIPLGRSNVTYRPGYKMVKITTDPKTYAVDKGGVLRHVTSEQLAETLYGLNWNNRIDDVPDPFFINYKVGAPIEAASEYNPNDVMTLSPTISEDKNFDDAVVNVTIGNVDTSMVPKSITIKKGTQVIWTNRDTQIHTVTGSAFDSGNLAAGATYTRTFSTAGTYDYACSIHPSMTGVIHVIN